MSNTPHITEVRQALLSTLSDLRNRDNPMDIDRAKAVAHVASVLVETAKVEVDFLRVTGSDRSEFLAPPQEEQRLPQPSNEPTAHNPFPVSASHRLNG
ncbi:hypothetical protein ACCQ08_24460 [Comamonas sp. SY3]|uniref:hypothetical protein n=1 Tax=Comamonas sp. SY3 TaxID=3243601 RepID=UPI003592EB0F